MSIVTVKTQVQAFLSLIPDLGTITIAALDADGVPREARAQRFWMLGVAGTEDRGRSFGTTDIAVNRAYQVRLEGWHGFSAANEITVEWDALVDLILCRVQAANLPPTTLDLPGIYAITDVRSEGLEVRQVRDPLNKATVYRAHHVLITFTLGVTERYTRS